MKKLFVLSVVSVLSVAAHAQELQKSEPLLFCANIQKSIEFYSDKLGFNVTDQQADNPIWARLTRGDCALMLVVAPDGGDWDALWKELGGKPKGGGNWLYIRTDDVDKLHAELKTKKVNFAGGTADAPVERPWGAREFIVVDPDNYVTVFTQPR